MIEIDKKKNIKRQRIKSYFIDSAKKIILNEGIENISVRKVADLAGYSYSTIYNHFKDLNELLYHVKADMVQDVMGYMKDSMPNKLYDIEDIKKINSLHIKYYTSNPHIFRFFYSYKLNPIEGEFTYLPDVEKSWESIYKGFVLSGAIKEEDVSIIAKTLIYSINGVLTLYFSNNELSIDKLCVDMDQITEYVLGNRK